MHFRVGLFIVLVGTWLACSQPPCDTSNCSGCCKEGVCYLGGCGTGGGSSGGGAGGGGGGGGVACAENYLSCSDTPCCAADSYGNPISCVAGTCKRTCKSSGPCSSSSECCKDPLSTYGNYCDLNKNECTTCGNRGARCYTRGEACCPGIYCGSKSATPKYLECL